MPGNTNINEGVTFSITIGATDPDVPTNHLAFALGTGARVFAAVLLKNLGLRAVTRRKAISAKGGSASG